jgi:hypothetical protein
VTLERAPLSEVVEDLAHAVVADRRAGRPPCPTLTRYIDLFAPELTEVDGRPLARGAGWRISERLAPRDSAGVGVAARLPRMRRPSS